MCYLFVFPRGSFTQLKPTQLARPKPLWSGTTSSFSRLGHPKILIDAYHASTHTLHHLAQGNELASSLPPAAVRHRAVGDGVLAEVRANHFGLDLDGVENLTVVHANH